MPTEYFSSYDGMKIMAKVADDGRDVAANLVPKVYGNREGELLAVSNDRFSTSCDEFTTVTLNVETPDYNPLNLPPFTMRLQMVDDTVDPTTWGIDNAVWTKVQGTDDTWDITYANENWAELFYKKVGIKSVLGANTTGVTSLNTTFGCQNWNGDESTLTSVALFDTSTVTDMAYMFQGCYLLESLPLFDTSNVVDMQWMFCECHALTEIPLFDTHNVTNMEGMLDCCSGIDEIPPFNTSKVTTLEYFADYTGITRVPKLDTRNVTTMDSAFEGCASLVEFPDLDYSNVECMSYAFTECTGLTGEIPTLNLKNCDKIKSMFDGCTGITSVSLDTSDLLWDMRGAFRDCSSLVDLYISNAYNVWEGDIDETTFDGCTSLENVTILNMASVASMSGIDDDDPDIMTSIFSSCDALKTVTITGAISLTTTESLFVGKENLESVTITDTTSLSNTVGMFLGCESLTSVNIGSTANVTDMTDMFDSCASLVTVPMLNTSKVTSMLQMFFGCTALTSVPLFDTNKVTDFTSMFDDCVSLISIPLFDTSSAVSVNGMFAGCENVETGSLALYRQMSSQANPPGDHDDCFGRCGINTQTGQAELEQIPADWK